MELPVFIMRIDKRGAGENFVGCREALHLDWENDYVDVFVKLYIRSAYLHRICHEPSTMFTRLKKREGRG